MAFCTNCGNKINEGAAFCSSCGAPTGAKKEENTSQENTSSTENKAPEKTQAKADGSNSKLMGVLAYLWVLVVIPIFAAKDDKFARFHANQGLILLILDFAWWIFLFIYARIVPYNGFTGALYSLIEYGVGLILFVLAILGIINVVKGETKELPIVGKFQILK